MNPESSGWFVKARDIIYWTETNKRDSEEMLPLLVKKLILFCCKPKEIEFDSGDLVQIGGWDGILEVEQGNQFIPDGISGWEFGTEAIVNNKANGDYEKRTTDPDPLDREITTFVFATSRLWTKKKSWVAAKQKEQEWKDVKGINAGNLEAWLAECPPVHRWFANLLGKRTSDLWDLDQGWDALSHITTIPLNLELFLNGRNKEQDDLFSRLDGHASVIRVKAQSKNEAYGFILATLKSNFAYANKVLIVKNQNAWDWLIDTKQPLILIPDGFSPIGSGKTVAHGHFVIETLDNQDTAQANIQIDRPPRQERINALKSMGLQDKLAEQIYIDTNGYLEPMLRHSKLSPLDQIRVSWNSKTSSDILFAILFATEWDGNNQYDREALSSLAGGIDYSDLEKTITELSKLPDAPIRLLGNIWQVISKIDMWLLIAPQLSVLHLERLGTVAKKVLGDIDPSFDLAPEERYMAGIKGAVPLYSVRLKRWIADSLALVSSYGNAYFNVANLRPSDYARVWARQIFDTAKDAKNWYSMGESLPLLAESAPQEFLSAVEKMSEGETPAILDLFEKDGDGIFGGCPHAALLWALERVSWNKSYLSLVSSILARLSEIDPGGRYSNRPFRSLVGIFIGWVNNTQANHEERVQIIESVLLKQYPKISWKLLLALLPGKTTVTSGLNRPIYQDWAIETERKVLIKDYQIYVSSITDILFREVEKDLDNQLIDLLESLRNFDDEYHVKLIQRLKSINADEINPTVRGKVTDTLRKFISKSRKFSDAEWSTNEELLIQWEEIIKNFEPDDVVSKNTYLFNDYFPDLLYPRVTKDFDYKQEEKLITQTRILAIENIFEARDFDGIEKLIEQCSYPSFVGHSLSLSKYSDNFLGKIKEWTEKDDSNLWC